MSLSYYVLLLNRQLMAYYKQALEEQGVDLSLGDMLFLSYVLAHEGCRQDDMVREFTWDKSHISRFIQQLEDRGLLARQPSPADRRVKLVYTTPLGKSYEGLIRGIQSQWGQEVLGANPQLCQDLEDQLAAILTQARQLVDCPSLPNG